MHRSTPPPTAQPKHAAVSALGEQVAVAPLLIAEKNCEAAIGRSWRWTLDTARALGVPVLTVRRRPVIPAQALLEALERAGIDPEQSAPQDIADAAPRGPVSSADDVLARLGMEASR